MRRKSLWLVVAAVVAIAGWLAWERRAQIAEAMGGRVTARDSLQAPGADPAAAGPASADGGNESPGAAAPDDSSPAQRADESAPAAEAGSGMATARAPGAPALTPAQARERMRERQRLQDCERVVHATSPDSASARERREWRWLPPEQVALEQVGLREAAARVGQGCPPRPATPEARRRQQADMAADLAAAAAAGDLEARLRSWRYQDSKTDGGREALRALLYDVLLSGDAELIAQIGEFQWQVNPSRQTTAEDLVPHGELWRLVGCDLGARCSRGSPALDRLCLSTSTAACAAPSVAAALQGLLPAWQFQLLQQRRAELLARIRNGQIAGILDPPRQPAPGGG
jgi:hypothetical protein